MLKHCPCDKSPINDNIHQANMSLKTWFKTKLAILKPRDWFELGHDIRAWRIGSNGLKHPMIQKGLDVVIKQLRLALVKSKNSTHLVVIPRLIWPLWMKAICKIADIVFSIEHVHKFWTPDMHEPLIVAFIFPFLP